MTEAATDRTTYQAVVHKANVPLMQSESLRQFTTELQKSAKPMLMQKFNGGSDGDADGDAWPLEVFATKAVFMVIPEWADVSKDVTVAFAFERDDEGEFKFGEVQKVKAVTSYEVTKRAELPKAMEMPNWASLAEVETTKSLWAGVL